MIDFSLRVLATTTRIPWRCSTETILSAPVVASSATTSLGRQALREQLQRRHPRRDPTRRSDPPVLGDRDLAEVSMHIQPKPAHHSPLVDIRTGARRDTRQRRIRALSTPGQVAGAATNNVELAAHQSERPARPRLPTTPHVPEAPCSRQGRTAVSSPDNAWTYTHNNSLARLLADQHIRHLKIRPHRPQTNGKVERFHQTMSREWAYAQTYASHHARNAALPHWPKHYNTRRPHSSLGSHPPISPFTTSEGRSPRTGRIQGTLFAIHSAAPAPGQDTVTTGAHLAFLAHDRESVHAFHATALANGAFVLDPDGNNTQAVWHNASS